MMTEAHFQDPDARETGEKGPTSDPRRDWLGFWVLIPLALLVLLAFWPTLDNDFVLWDDDKNFSNNPHFRGLGLGQFKWAWTTFLLGVYQPIAWLLLEVQYALWELNPAGYHLASILMQIANAAVLWLLTVSLLDRCLPDLCRQNRVKCFLAAGLATALHAAHPLRVEVVAWASCQPYLPCALFYMLSVLAYLRAFPADSAPNRVWLVRCFLLFAAALLCKAVAVSLPAVLLILDYYPLRRLGGGPARWLGRSAWRAWIEKIPFFVLSLVFMDLAIMAKRHSPKLLPVQSFGISSGQIAQACYGIWFYLVKTFVPVNITAYYPLPPRVRWYDYPYIACILATLGMSLVLFLGRRRWPGLLAAWLVYLVILAPNLGLVQISNQIAGDRYCYVPLASGVVVLGAGFCLLFHRRGLLNPLGAGLIAAGLALSGELVLLSRDQCRTWKDGESLWTYALSHGGARDAHVWNFMGNALADRGDPDSVMAFYRESIRINPRYPDAHNNVGLLLAKQGKYDGATVQFAEAIRLRPDFAEFYNNMGAALVRQGKLEEAVRQYAESIRLTPEYALAHKNVGRILLELGRTKEAVMHLAEALWLDPTDPEADRIFESVLLKHGDLQQPAVAACLSRLVLDPHDSGARQGLIDALREPERSATSP
jgi:tetratricopeptide (TPR) repeat protein